MSIKNIQWILENGAFLYESLRDFHTKKHRFREQLM